MVLLCVAPEFPVAYATPAPVARTTSASASINPRGFKCSDT